MIKNLIQRNITVILLLLVISSNISKAAEKDSISQTNLINIVKIVPPLKSPFNSNLIRTRAKETTINFTCPSPPEPPKNMEIFESIYKDNNDKSRSVIDEEKRKKHKENSKNIALFERYITDAANLYITTMPPYEEAAKCVNDLIKSWAKKNALLGKASHTGIAVRKWTLASIASAWLQVKSAENLDYNDVYLIEKWIKKLAYQVKNDYSENPEKKSRNNNHLYWAAWAVAASAIILNDKELFDWAMDKAKLGINQIQNDGSLPLEMNRMSRAFHYHIFAAAPLIMLAETGQINGYNLYNENNGALHRLVHLITSNLENTLYFEEITGKKQDTKSILKNGTLGWLETYNSRFPSKNITEILNNIKRTDFYRSGGDMSLLFRKNSHPNLLSDISGNEAQLPTSSDVNQ